MSIIPLLIHKDKKLQELGAKLGSQVYHASRKSAKNFTRHVGEKGLVRAIQENAATVYKGVSNVAYHTSDFFNKIYNHLKHEWRTLKTPITEARHEYLIISIATIQDKIHNKIHGEGLSYEEARSWATNGTIRKYLEEAFVLNAEMMGRSSEIKVLFESVKRDEADFTMINYLIELLCDTYPSFEIFSFSNPTERMEREQFLRNKIEKCIPKAAVITEEYKMPITKPRNITMKGHYKISPNASSAELKRLAAQSAKTNVNEYRRSMAPQALINLKKKKEEAEAKTLLKEAEKNAKKEEKEHPIPVIPPPAANKGRKGKKQPPAPAATGFKAKLAAYANRGRSPEYAQGSPAYDPHMEEGEEYYH